MSILNRPSFIARSNTPVKGSAKLVASAKNAQYTAVTTTAENRTYIKRLHSGNKLVRTHCDDRTEKPEMKKLKDLAPFLKGKPRRTRYLAPLELPKG